MPGPKLSLLVRVDVMIARCIAAVVGLFLAGAASAAPAEAAQLAVRARAILLKHCASCHGGKSPRSTLLVAKYGQMVAERPTRFVAPRQPDLSQAIELVEEGSMPPGRLAKLTSDEQADLRAWGKSGAAADPARFDDEFEH